jgi:hypothetical protein
VEVENRKTRVLKRFDLENPWRQPERGVVLGRDRVASSLTCICHSIVLATRDIPTPRVATWAPMQVKNILDRSSN